MDDDLGTPAAVAVLYDAVREGNRRWRRPARRRATAARCAAMLDVLGLDPPTRPGRPPAAATTG
jgi:cysteinyl-tRNA synthetase